MIINQAQISMNAHHEYHEIRESSDQWVLAPAPSISRPPPESDASVSNLSDRVDISAAGSLLAMQRERQALDLDAPMDERSRLNLMILQAVFEAMTGRPLTVNVPDRPQEIPSAKVNSQISALTVKTPPPRAQRNLTPGNSSVTVYQRQERVEEQEILRFNSTGVIKTRDGNEIRFAVTLGMHREFLQESRLAVIQPGAANKIDPLVINFDGKGVGLSQTRFAFDLDSDGVVEQIANLRAGNGFLALDKNNDGVINSGTELFGPDTGRGFIELAAYDEDGNQFIDEADSIYQKLRVWIVNDDGSSQLVALGDKHLGAMYIGHMTTPFQLTDNHNNTLGEVTHSGIYVTDTGGVGLIQEVDYRV